MRTNLKSLLLAGVAAAQITVLTPAFAADGDNGSGSGSPWMVRARAIGVLPDVSSTVNIGGHIDVKDAYVPEFDVSYFFTKNISTELILATSRHTIKYNGPTELGKTWVLPPTLTVQYHFMPEEKFNPYLGAGLNYSMFYHEKASGNFTDLHVNGGVGYALQAGADYWLTKNWGLNVDVKKVWLKIDANLNGGAIRTNADLNPTIVGAGVSYRF